ncbi:MAG: hypothetical protein ACTSSC_07390 [Promethearchaeota archaeon]
MRLERVVCPNCKYVMVQPFRKNCPNCYFNLQEEKLQQEERYNALLLRRSNRRKAEQDRINRESNLQKFKKIYRNTTTISKKINENLTLKLENRITNLYVNGKRFRQCKRLVLNILKEDIPRYEEIDSIDEAANVYNEHLYRNKIVTGPMATPVPNQRHDITPEQEFWGHCSNIQVWVENDYDTRILMSNLSFPLLRELAKLGDPKAKKVYKEEIALRLESGYPSVVQYLIIQGYLGEFSPSEFHTILESNNLIKKLSDDPKVLTLFLISGLYYFPTLTENITLWILKLPNGKEIIISVVQFKPKTATYKPWIMYIPRYLFSLKETLVNFLEHIDENTNSDISDILQAIEQQIQYYHSEGYLVKPPKEEGRLDKTFKVLLLGTSPKKSRLLTEIVTPSEEKKLPFNLFGVPVYLEKPNAKVKLTVWDIDLFNRWGMTSRYSSSAFTSLYFKDAKAVIFVFDINNSNQFGTFQFLNSLNANISRQIPKVIVGIKEDLESSLEKTASKIMAEQLSEKLNAHYFEISLIDRDNVYKIFHKIAELVSRERPIESNINVKGEIMEVKKTKRSNLSLIECKKCRYILNANSLRILLMKGRIYCPNCGRVVKR